MMRPSFLVLVLAGAIALGVAFGVGAITGEASSEPPAVEDSVHLLHKRERQRNARMQKPDEVAMPDLERSDGVYSAVARRKHAQALEELRTLRVDDTEMHNQLQADLARSFLVEGDKAVEAATDWIDGRNRRDQIDVVLFALAEAGNRASQAALLGVARQNDARFDDRISALLRMGELRTISAESMSDLLNMAEAEVSPKLLRSTALLSAGAALSRMDAAGEPLVKELLAYVELKMEDPDVPPGEVGDALLAVGNVGSVRSLPLLVRALGSEDPGLRGDAVRALRRVPGKRAEEQMLNAMKDDEDEFVRNMAILSSIERHDPSLYEGLKRSAAADPNPGVRITAARAIVTSALALDEVREVLSEMATVDADPGVRNVADELLRNLEVER